LDAFASCFGMKRHAGLLRFANCELALALTLRIEWRPHPRFLTGDEPTG
jgi:hypothetical protein